QLLPRALHDPPRTRTRLGEYALACSTDADELDRHVEIALDELDVVARRARQFVARRGAVEQLLPARERLPNRPRVVEVALMRGEVRRLRAVAQLIGGAHRQLRERREDV